MTQDGEFKLTHGSATLEKTLAAAANVERVVGRSVNGDRKALQQQLLVEDVALLVQFVRNHQTPEDLFKSGKPYLTWTDHAGERQALSLANLQAYWTPRPLREGELMAVYMEFDRHAAKGLGSVEYLLKFAAAVSEATASNRKAAHGNLG